VDADDLVVLDRLVVALAALFVGDLHKEAGGERLADVDIVALVLERGRDEVEVVLLHRPPELRADIVGLLEGPLREKVVVRPVALVLVCSKGGVSLLVSTAKVVAQGDDALLL
jgi:hypothetical protein